MTQSGIGRTETGPVRDNNEDSILVINSAIGLLNNLFVIADGMGGHNAGEVASSKAIECFCEYVKNSSKEFQHAEILLSDGVRNTNEAVYRMSIENSAQRGMGTTFTVCTFDDEKMYYSHVGDSRIYVIRDKKITQLTEDHTYVNELMKVGKISSAEARVHEDRHILTRALGTEENLLVDEGCYELKGNETFVLCSDGLSNYVADKEILRIVGSKKSNEDKINELYKLVYKYSGADNISVILV